VPRFVVLALFVFLTVAAAPAVAATDTLATSNNACASQNAAFTEDDLSGITSPCAAQPGTLLVETLYFQNASRTGGTALAAYPLVRLRTGIVHNLELVIDPPSQVAESGLHGLGVYPVTRLGYGLNYTLGSNGHSASGFGVEMQPPSSRFSVDERQPKYIFDYTFSMSAGRRGTISAIASGESSHLVGFGRIAPAGAVRYAYDASARTQISTDIGARVVARGARAQAYSDIALNQRLRKNITYTFGLGTTFNGMINAGKAHYMASGFNFHLK
jgi:hypothetical protein